MDSETEVVEVHNSRPFFQNGGKRLYVVANLGDKGVTLTAEVVNAIDGSVLTTETFDAPARGEAVMEIYGWSHEVVSPRDAPSSAPYVLRLTALGAKTGPIAVAVETAEGIDSYSF